MAVDVTIDDRKLVDIIRKLGDQGRTVEVVADGVEYGIYQELGTSRGVAAKHFMRNAVGKVRPWFIRNWDLAKLTDAAKFIRATAFEVEGWAKKYSPVDTGALRGSIHVVKGGQHKFRVNP